MNLRLVSQLLGIVCLLLGGFMVFSMPWAHPSLGARNADHILISGQFEHAGFQALFFSTVVCVIIGLFLLWMGRVAKPRLYRKESMAVVGLSWVLATVLGALPFQLAGVYRGPSLRIADVEGASPIINLASSGTTSFWDAWHVKPPLSPLHERMLRYVLDAGADGRTPAELSNWLSQPSADPDTPTEEQVALLIGDDADWSDVWLLPGEQIVPKRGLSQGPVGNYRIRYAQMSWIDSMFESQSGFSTTGATVMSELENPRLVPHCILFWRSSTHFLGGLGIIVLFVAILGQGSAGKALMRAELPGPTEDRSQTRMQRAAWNFAGMYIALNLILIAIMKSFGMTWFDAICHAFGTLATGGFSTYNASFGHFDSAKLDYIVILFMVLAGSNFTLLILAVLGKPFRLLRDVEWQSYIAIIAVATLLIVLLGRRFGDFASAERGVRFGLFQVVSIMTTTGYGTHDFDTWNAFGRMLLLALMFVGGCAGSTGGGLKVIRYVLLTKVLGQEVEKSFHPRVVRQMRLSGKVIDDPSLAKSVLVYFCLVGAIFIASWLFVVLVEPSSTWTDLGNNKLIDSSSIVAATLNNIGPGLGTVGATKNYGHLHPLVKHLCTWLMMIGRVEVYVIICLFLPGFWRSR